MPPKPARRRLEATPATVREGARRRKGFDPWTATESEARQASKAEPGSRLIDEAPAALARYFLPATAPLVRWWAAHALLACRSDVERGRGTDVLCCIAMCAEHDLQMPPWLASLYLARYKRVACKEIDSWDDPAAFGRPYPPGARVREDRQWHLDAVEVYRIVGQFRCRCRGKPIKRLWAAFTPCQEPTSADLALFGPAILRRVGALGCSSTKAQELWAYAKQEFGEPRELSGDELEDPIPSPNFRSRQYRSAIK